MKEDWTTADGVISAAGLNFQNAMKAMIDPSFPVKEIEYFLTYDAPDFKNHGWDYMEHIIPKGTIVINVRENKLRGSRWEFTVKDTGVVSDTAYPWALAEHTEENLKKYKDFLLAEAETEKYVNIKDAKWKATATLNRHEGIK